MVGAMASLRVKNLVPVRRKVIKDIREETVQWLEKQGHAVLPSEANMIMVDLHRPAKAFGDAMLKAKVAIGRPWSSMPNHVHISIGTREEMAAFRGAFTKVINA